MDFHYEIKNKKLKELVEKKAKETGRTSDEVVWGYINRGLYLCGEDEYSHSHSDEFLRLVNETLGLD